MANKLRDALTEDQVDRLRELANAAGRSLAAELRRAVALYLYNPSLQCAELADPVRVGRPKKSDPA